jgi:hypothetical protein
MSDYVICYSTLIMGPSLETSEWIVFLWLKRKDSWTDILFFRITGMGLCFIRSIKNYEESNVENL